MARFIGLFFLGVCDCSSSLSVNEGTNDSTSSSTISETTVDTSKYETIGLIRMFIFQVLLEALKIIWVRRTQLF